MSRTRLGLTTKATPRKKKKILEFLVDTSIQMSELYVSLKWLHRLWISLLKVRVCKVLILQKLASQNTEGSREHLGKRLQQRGYGPSRELSAPSLLSSRNLVHESPGTNVTGSRGGLQEKTRLLSRGSKVKQCCGAE